MSSRDKTLRAIAIHLPKTQNEIAEIREVSKGLISQHCKQLREGGFLNEDLAITDKGRRRLLGIWPELGGQIASQDDLPI